MVLVVGVVLVVIELRWSRWRSDEQDCRRNLLLFETVSCFSLCHLRGT